MTKTKHDKMEFQFVSDVATRALFDQHLEYAKDLAKRGAELADLVYNALFTEQERNFMASLPEGLLKTTGSIPVRIDHKRATYLFFYVAFSPFPEHHGFRRLDFDLSEDERKARLDKAERRVPYSNEYELREIPDALRKRIGAWYDEKVAFVDSIQRLHSKMRNELSVFRTVQDAMLARPELTSYLRDWTQKAREAEAAVEIKKVLDTKLP